MPLITTLANAGARGFGFSGVGVPSAPAIGTATASSTTSATVNYTAPSSNGGSPIVSYTAVAVPGGQTGTAVRSGSGSITVSGLTSGVSYQFYVYATNTVGNSPNSALSNSMTTAAVPGAPTVGMAYTTGATTASIDYIAPASDGGSAITSYTVVASPGGQTATVYRSGSGSISISGLSSGTTHQFRVYASNAYGNGPYSGYSNSVTTATVPGAPTIGAAYSTGTTTASVSYMAPADNGGSAITSYTAVASPGGQTATVYGSGSGTIVISGLSASTTYQFRVYATNAYGSSSYSGYSNSVTTTAAITVPGAPTIGTAVKTGSSTANVSFTAPADNGGSAITSYTVVASPGGQTTTVYQSGSGTVEVKGLSNSTTYQFRVYATNASGNSAYSGYSNSVTTDPAFQLFVQPISSTSSFPIQADAYTKTVTFEATCQAGSGTVNFTQGSVPSGGSMTISPTSAAYSGPGATRTITVKCTSTAPTWSASVYTFTVQAKLSGGTSAPSTIYTFTMKN